MARGRGGVEIVARSAFPGTLQAHPTPTQLRSAVKYHCQEDGMFLDRPKLSFRDGLVVDAKSHPVVPRGTPASFPIAEEIVEPIAFGSSMLSRELHRLLVVNAFLVLNAISCMTSIEPTLSRWRHIYSN